MSKLEVYQKDRELKLAEDLYSAFAARVNVSAMTTCPVEFTSAFVKFAGAQSCGKCTPCRIGFAQLARLIDRVLDGNADARTLKLIAELAENIYLSSDCALGYEAGAFALRAIKGYHEDFAYHVEHNDCDAERFAAVPCVEGCPAHVDIPAYMALVAEGRYSDAIHVIRNTNPFASACGLICEHPCELYCRRGTVDDPLNIRGVKRFAVDNAEGDVLPTKAAATDKRIAIIGGGPSGLTTAYFLALMGHTPMVYEQRAQLGGMLRYGIPAYRLPREDLDAEIEFILSAGVEVQLNTKVEGDNKSMKDAEGNAVSLKDLQSDYDAVYLAIGAHTENKLGLEGEDAQGVLSAVKLLRAMGDDECPDFTGKDIVVVGGGNVAMDCARTALRLGAAKVQIVYRRRKEDMTALSAEIEAAVSEGCELMVLHAPLAITTDDQGHANGLFVKQQIISEISGGRAKPIDAEEDAFIIPCDIVLMACGQKIDSATFEEGGIPTKWAAITAGEHSAVPDNEGIFAGGDCVTGPASAILAIAAGKAAAANIDSWLGYNHIISLEMEVPQAEFSTRMYCARSNMVEQHKDTVKGDFALVEEGLLHKEAMQEVGRCLRCDHFGLGSFKGGRSNKW